MLLITILRLEIDFLSRSHAAVPSVEPSHVVNVSIDQKPVIRTCNRLMHGSNTELPYLYLLPYEICQHPISRSKP